MGEEKLPEAVHRELLADTRDVIKKVKELKKSEDIQVFAVDAFLQLSKLAAVLAEALGERPERSRNPLSRRVREGGGEEVNLIVFERPSASEMG